MRRKFYLTFIGEVIQFLTAFRYQKSDRVPVLNYQNIAPKRETPWIWICIWI